MERSNEVRKERKKGMERGRRKENTQNTTARGRIPLTTPLAAL